MTDVSCPHAGDHFASPEDGPVPSVGLFWGVGTGRGPFRLVTAAVPLTAAEPYGDCLTDPRAPRCVAGLAPTGRHRARPGRAAGRHRRSSLRAFPARARRPPRAGGAVHHLRRSPPAGAGHRGRTRAPLRADRAARRRAFGCPLPQPGLRRTPTAPRPNRGSAARAPSLQRRALGKPAHRPPDGAMFLRNAQQPGRRRDRPRPPHLGPALPSPPRRRSGDGLTPPRPPPSSQCCDRFLHSMSALSPGIVPRPRSRPQRHFPAVRGSAKCLKLKAWGRTASADKRSRRGPASCSSPPQ